jgi:hypothetical protein
MNNLFKLAEEYYNSCLHGLNKVSFIRKLPNGKYRVLSEKGKNLGTCDSLEKAKKRLKQVEYFKYLDKNKSEDKILDLTDIDDYSYSAIVRKLRQKLPHNLILDFLKIYKSIFDAAVKKGLQQPDKIALQKTLVKFNKIKKIKLDKDMIKNAAVSELGDHQVVGKYISNIIKFILNRVPLEKRPAAISSLKNKIYHLNEVDLSNKHMPSMAAIAQCITFVKHILFNQDSAYIRRVVNSVVENL